MRDRRSRAAGARFAGPEDPATEDKDFGWLVFVGEGDSSGVILVRFPASARGALGAAVCDLVVGHADALPGAFAVIQPGHVRITRRGS